MLFSRTLLTFAFAALVSSQAFTATLKPAQQTKARADLVAYLTSVAAQPAYTAAVKALASVIPIDVVPELEDDPVGYIESKLTDTAEPAWFSALPTSAQAYFSSIVQAERSIISKNAKGPAPTNAVLRRR